MRKTAYPILFVLVLTLAFSLAGAVQTKTNPSKPLHPRPDRNLKLAESLRIPGEGEGYLIESVRNLTFDSDKNIYLGGTWTSAQKPHILKFSPAGKFLKDLVRQGEGPGEIQSWFDFSVAGGNVVLFDKTKRKVVIEKLDGTFLKENRKPEWSSHSLIGAFSRSLVFSHEESPREWKTSGLYEMRNRVVFLELESGTEKEIHAFFNRVFLVSPAQGGGGMGWDPFDAVIGEGRLYVNAARDYGIQVLDLATGKIVLTFRRDFKHVNREILPREKEFMTDFNAPKRKYEADVAGLMFGDGHLWVQTAVTAGEKRFHYDVFDPEGRFIDSFFVDLNGYPLKIEGGFLYAVIHDAEDLPALVKYRIDEPLGAK